MGLVYIKRGSALLVVVLLSIPLYAFGQMNSSFDNEIEKLLATYSMDKPYSIEFLVKTYMVRNGERTLHSEVSGQVLKDGSSFYYRYGETESYVSGDTSILIDNNTKWMQYKIIKGKKPTKGELDANPLAETLGPTANCDSSTYTANGSEGVLVCISGNAHIKQTTIRYSLPAYEILEVHYDYGHDEDGNGYEVDINYFPRKVGNDSSRLKTKHYLEIVSGGSVNAGPGYKGYTITKAD